MGTTRSRSKSAEFETVLETGTNERPGTVLWHRFIEVTGAAESPTIFCHGITGTNRRAVGRRGAGSGDSVAAWSDHGGNRAAIRPGGASRAGGHDDSRPVGCSLHRFGGIGVAGGGICFASEKRTLSGADRS